MCWVVEAQTGLKVVGWGCPPTPPARSQAQECPPADSSSLLCAPKGGVSSLSPHPPPAAWASA